MAGNSDHFEFSKGVTDILSKGQEGWIDILPWDFKPDGWIDVLSWDFKVTSEGDVTFKGVEVAEVQLKEADDEWLAGLLTNLHNEGFF